MEAEGSIFAGLEIEKRFWVSHGPRARNGKRSPFTFCERVMFLVKKPDEIGNPLNPEPESIALSRSKRGAVRLRGEGVTTVRVRLRSSRKKEPRPPWMLFMDHVAWFAWFASARLLLSYGVGSMEHGRLTSDCGKPRAP
jgi:hypothetical protein